MIAKLLGALATAKGAAAAGVIVAAGVTGGVVATNEDVRGAIGSAVQNVTQTVTSASPSPKASATGEPAVVAARNEADKKLRDAFQDDQQKLEKLRGTKVEGADRSRLEDLIKDADARLRARLTKALDDVAALTLGREGRESASPRPSGSPDVRASFTAESQASVNTVVRDAIAAMNAIVSAAERAVAALPTSAPGKPSDLPGGKPTDVPGGRPSTAPGAKPLETPGGRPSDRPSPQTPSARPSP